MIRHEHVTGNVLGYLGMKRCVKRKRCHPSQSLVVAQKVPPMRHPCMMSRRVRIGAMRSSHLSGKSTRHLAPPQPNDLLRYWEM